MIKLTKLLEAKNLFKGKKSTDLTFKGYNDLLLYLKKECSEILNLYKSSNDKFLLRGISSSKNYDIVKYRIRPDRKPSFMDEKTHNIVNNVITDLGGVAHRGNSIFCTTLDGVASTWGKNYIVFPINGFNVTYFSKFDGPYMYNKLITSDANAIKNMFLKYDISFDKNSMFSSENVNTEYLIQCDYYYGISQYRYEGSIVKNLLNDIENI